MEDGESENGDAFAIPDLWAPSRFLNPDSEYQSVLFGQRELDEIDIVLPPIVGPLQSENVFFGPPKLSLEPLEDLPTLAPLATCPDEMPEPLGGVDLDLGDIWSLVMEEPQHAAKYHSWEGFEDVGFQKEPSPYLTEGGASIFDTAVSAKDDYLRIANSEYLVINTKVYAASVLALGLGRSSVLFSWDEDVHSFRPTMSKMRIPGYSADALEDFLAPFVECANITRSLQAFVDRSYSRNISPGQVALAEAVSTMLGIIQSCLSGSETLRSGMLQLQALFRPAHSLLTFFHRVVNNITSARSDEAMLSTVFQEMQLLEHGNDTLREIILEVLISVSRPWLEFCNKWLGLERETGLPMSKEGKSKSFVRVENRDWIDEQGFEMHEPDFILDYDKVPSFIAPEDARSMFEVGRSLRLLREHHADHPLVKADVVAIANPPKLTWRFPWQDILQVEAKALQYEKDLLVVLQQGSNDGITDVLSVQNPESASNDQLNFFGKPEFDMQAYVLASMKTFDQPLYKKPLPDQFSTKVAKYLTRRTATESQESVFAPPIASIPILSFNPIISVQARLVNGICMRMFFNAHNLREHFSIQRQFHLLGSGVFSSRLSHALFDPELESAERHRGVARSGGIMGLRLGRRETWPPASSELRLALMGVLTESYVAGSPGVKKPHSGTFLDQSSLPGDLSFAVRDMSDEEIEKCLNADSIEALDFLRLSYKPPAPLEVVFTPMVLYKYDQLFKLLLRVLRMLYVVSALYQETRRRASHRQEADNTTQKFCFEAHHFVTSVSGYFFDTGVESTWRAFERKLTEVEIRVNGADDISALGDGDGLDKLRDYHERVLDKIMFALFLRKRQQPVLNLLEEIFALILDFFQHSRQKSAGTGGEALTESKIRDCYVKFRKKVGVFITVCTGLSEKKGYGEKRNAGVNSSAEGLFDGDDLVEENTVTQLLTRLEMSKYYSTSVKI